MKTKHTRQTSKSGGIGGYGAKSRTADGTMKGFQGGAAGEVAKTSRSRPLSGARNIAWK